ncbi:MAG: hypothetical protein Q8K11_15270 [Phenylobacterium sp.]|uniref:hypothetical protein n=1 Tax=Phenylobacterium sp. TaxID=1871053 RepID=UPI00273127DE|nr:hypothetical protein [Phenylobacterium sp.]MDP2011531.1 hypothetical protein [Phenylobacterium sp.]MDP3632683.1 hypothetical protein [Phenylobacterium sp.]MDP3868847.1 hypothetical protein [Phenylobacterium sp.]
MAVRFEGIKMSAPQQAFASPPVRLVSRAVMHHAFPVQLAWRRVFDAHSLSLLMWLSVELANTDHLFGAQELTGLVRLGRIDDEARRPIAVRALGASLSLDSETIRRWAKRLVDAGFCERRPEGLIVPSAAYEREAIEHASRQTLEALGALLADLNRWGVTLPQISMPLGARPWDAAHANPTFARRLFVLTFLQFILRFGIESQGIFERSTMSSSVFFCVFSANHRRFFDDDDLNRRYATFETPVPAELREPISIRAIAKRLDYAVETTRRHVHQLVEANLLERRGDGFIMSDAALARPEIVKSAADISGSLTIMLRRMDRVAAALVAA